jgi:hypothetical protein
MSGRELVQSRRDGDPPRQPRDIGRIFDALIGLVAVVAIGSLAYFGYTTWLAPRFSPQRPAQAKLVAAVTPEVSWTDADMSRCKARARAAAESPETGDAVLVERTVTEGFAGMATLVECRLTTKIARFCDPKEKSALVEMVNDYLGRVDLLKLGLGAQGAPMAIMGGAFGGEMAAGRDIYDAEKDATLSVMETYHNKVASALRTLGKRGVVSAADFGGFAGTPATITDIFKNLSITNQLCT